MLKIILILTLIQAVLVQFRLAECLFEMAKDFRKLKNTEKSAGAIADGRKILEAALRDYPNTSHAAEGEFLLANLYEQLAEEERQARKQREKDGEDLSNEPDKADPLFREAVLFDPLRLPGGRIHRPQPVSQGSLSRTSRRLRACR